MRSVADFYQDCISAVGQQPPLDVQLPDAVGCVLAEDVEAPFNLPVADLAACDGYAVAAADLEGARPDAPVVLPVTEEIRAGDIHPAALIRGRAIRIASGAPMPQGADAVLALEFSDHGISKVSAKTQPAVGENIRRKAEDVEEGTVVLRAGTRVGARQVALLAGVGRSRVLVHPRPRVVILSIGDEIVEPGREARPGTVFDANGHALSTAITDAGAQTFRVSAVPDERSVLRETIEDQLVRADLILTTGGISYGVAILSARSYRHLVRFASIRLLHGPVTSLVWELSAVTTKGEQVHLFSAFPVTRFPPKFALRSMCVPRCATCRGGLFSTVPALKRAWIARGIHREAVASSCVCV